MHIGHHCVALGRPTPLVMGEVVRQWRRRRSPAQQAPGTIGHGETIGIARLLDLGARLVPRWHVPAQPVQEAMVTQSLESPYNGIARSLEPSHQKGDGRIELACLPVDLVSQQGQHLQPHLTQGAIALSGLLASQIVSSCSVQDLLEIPSINRTPKGTLAPAEI
ncbi:hypothetical protein [Devosia marina]|uniref:Uncharacterized protein n=1 Tax=Devosia marina TaxID=2683198 RepID=A0A7X3FUP1_9HYPH|nr:hypothetical protein [Devosia marina]MVT01055.1 hypothetical protein [Devosia marina]